MLPTIQLDHEALFDTNKIRNQCSQRNLAAEFEAAKVAIAQMAPE